MIEPIWKLMPKKDVSFIDMVWRKWENGREDSCLVTAEEYVKWVAQGNTPIPADE